MRGGPWNEKTTFKFRFLILELQWLEKLKFWLLIEAFKQKRQYKNIKHVTVNISHIFRVFVTSHNVEILIWYKEQSKFSFHEVGKLKGGLKNIVVQKHMFRPIEILLNIFSMLEYKKYNPLPLQQK